MAHDAARSGRASRFPSSSSERGDHGRSTPAPDYAVHDEDDDDFDDADSADHFGGFDDPTGGRDGLASLADELIDGLVPPEVDWRHIVRRHPLPALLIVGVGGYLLGRTQGKLLLRAVSALAVARVESEVLGRIEDELG